MSTSARRRLVLSGNFLCIAAVECESRNCWFQIQGGKGDVTITNDGATILKEMQVLHPAAKMVSLENRLEATQQKTCFVPGVRPSRFFFGNILISVCS